MPIDGFTKLFGNARFCISLFRPHGYFEHLSPVPPGGGIADITKEALAK